jgi:hypothetical protein
MLFVTEYRFRSGMDRAQVQRVMDLFGQRGAEAGEIAHYVKADGTGGFTINEVDDPATSYAASLAYAEFIEFSTSPVLKIDDAIGPITTFLGG